MVRRAAHPQWPVNLRLHPGLDPADLGREIVRAREYAIPWKKIQELTGYTRTRLWQLYEQARLAKSAE